MAARKQLTRKQRELMQKHRLAPKLLSKAEVMKQLGLGRDYHAFNRLFYKATMDRASLPFKSWEFQLEEEKN